MGVPETSTQAVPFAPARALAKPPPIVIRDVVKVLGGRRVLDGVTLSVPAGGISALMGPSGVGKTVTVKLILGLMNPDRGEVFLDGRSVPDMTEKELACACLRCGVLLQGSTLFECGLFGNLSIHDNITFALAQAGTAKSEQDAMAADWLREVGLAAHAEKRPFELSAGMRKRIALARALCTPAPILVLDDPDTGLDPVRLNMLCDLVMRVQAERSATVLITTHNVGVARRMADYVAVMNDGVIAAWGPTADVLPSRHDRSTGIPNFANDFLNGRADTALDPGEPPAELAGRPPSEPREWLVWTLVVLACLCLLLIIGIPVFIALS